jgi:hypothetical protein
LHLRSKLSYSLLPLLLSPLLRVLLVSSAVAFIQLSAQCSSLGSRTPSRLSSTVRCIECTRPVLSGPIPLSSDFFRAMLLNVICIAEIVLVFL